MYYQNPFAVNEKSRLLEKEDVRSWLEVRRGLFPALYTLIACAAFGYPVIVGLELASEASVVYWIGWHVRWLVFLVPICLGLSHILHVFHGRPHFPAVVMSTVVPALIVIVMGLMFKVPIAGIATNLGTNDCTLLDESVHLIEGYEAAQQMFDNCVAGLMLRTNSSRSEIVSAISLPDCDEYSVSIRGNDLHAEWRQAWYYLAELERTQACSGWCGSGQVSLWTAAHTKKDDCNKAVAFLFTTWVQRQTSLLVRYGCVCLFVSLVSLVCIQEFLIRVNIQW